MARSRLAATTPLLPVTIPHGKIRYAPGIRAGRWIFATGHKATRGYVSGIAPEVLRPDLPQWDTSKRRREADQIFRNLGEVFTAGGADLGSLVRLDQHYTTHKAVEPYHDARRAILADHIPPSTSTLAQRFLLANQEIEAHAIGVVPLGGFRPEHIRPKGHEVHPTSGYSPALAVGDYVFVAGRIADSFTPGEGLAQEARLPPGHLWKGSPVKLEAEFIMRRKIEPALKAAGSSLDNVVKCQVYLRDQEDVAPFNEVWSRFFPTVTPATTLIPTATPGFFLSDARVEINTIALRDAGTVRREIISAGVTPPFAGHSHAVRAGDLLFMSGMLAIDRDGLVEDARPDPRQPYFGSSIQAQMDRLLTSAEQICRATGTSLANVARIEQFHTDLRDFYPAYQAWERHVPEQHLPLSAVEVPFLPVPGCTVQLDLWVYVP